MADELGRGALTYSSIGATIDGHVPEGFRAVERVRVIGDGPTSFQEAVAATMNWGIQRGSGVRVRAAERPLRSGDDVVMRVPLWPRDVPCRVVCVIDEPRRAGFAYGTLPGHPERGEEAFVVELDEDGSVRLRIRSFSRPASLIFWIGYPVVRLMQEIYTRRYERALTGSKGSRT